MSIYIYICTYLFICSFTIVHSIQYIVLQLKILHHTTLHSITAQYVALYVKLCYTCSTVVYHAIHHFDMVAYQNVIGVLLVMVLYYAM